MTKLDLHGVIPPVVTAFDTGGAIDRATQRALTEWHINAGAAGIFVAGTTGEGAALTLAQLAELVEVTVEVVAGRVPVLAGALAPGTELVVRRSKVAATAGADAVVATTPFYGSLSQSEVERHFRTVAAASSVPILAYSIPPVTHQATDLRVIDSLFADSVVVGLKDSGHDVAYLLKAVELGKTHGKAVFSGYEPLALAALLAGASGVVASAGNLDPEGFAELYRLAAARQWDQAEQVHRRLRTLVGELSVLGAATGVGPISGLIGGIKACLQATGRMANRSVLEPLASIPDDALATTTRLACLAYLSKAN